MATPLLRKVLDPAGLERRKSARESTALRLLSAGAVLGESCLSHGAMTPVVETLDMSLPETAPQRTEVATSPLGTDLMPAMLAWDQPTNKIAIPTYMKIKSYSSTFEPCPEYKGQAVCVDATALKTQSSRFGDREVFKLVFEVDADRDDGTRFCVWSVPFTPSLHEKSRFRSTTPRVRSQRAEHDATHRVTGR